MNLDYTLALDSAQKLDRVVRGILKKYQDPKRRLRGEDWLFEYAALNWGSNLLPPYLALTDLRLSLSRNAGKWGCAFWEINESRLERITDREAGSMIAVFEVSPKLLIPGEVKRLGEGNAQNPGGYSVDLALGIKQELLLFDKNGEQRGYLRDPEGGQLQFEAERWKNLTRSGRDYFRIPPQVVLHGDIFRSDFFFGEDAGPVLAPFFRMVAYRGKKETPIQCIRRIKRRIPDPEDPQLYLEGVYLGDELMDALEEGVHPYLKDHS